MYFDATNSIAFNILEFEILLSKIKVGNMKGTLLLMGIILLMCYTTTAMSDESSDTTKSSGFELIMNAGAGLTIDFNDANSSTRKIDNGPIIGLGLEIPFSKSHYFGFELQAHSWISKFNLEQDYQGNINNYYYKVGSNYCGQTGLSGAFKFYPFSSESKLRLSVSYGWLFMSMNQYKSNRYNSSEFGIQLYYRLSDKYQISANYKLYGRPSSSWTGNSSVTPDNLMMMLNYNFEL